MAALNDKAEEQLAQLKNFYEMEKERLEVHAHEEKERATKKMQSLIDEYETRMRDEQSQHEEDLAMLQEEIRDNAQRHQLAVSHAEHDNACLLQKITSLEQHIKEKEERMSSESALV